MAVLGDLLTSYHRPSAVMVRQLSNGIGEERLLAYVMGGSVLTFLARLPKVAEAYAASSPNEAPLGAYMATSFVATAIFAPLFLYMIAALSHLVAKGLGGQGSWFKARFALFWSFFALQPLVLLQGLVLDRLGIAALVNYGPQVIGVIFLVIWFFSLKTVESRAF